MEFDVRRIDTLELKFKRHKLSFSFDAQSQTIIIGKSKNTNQKLILGVASLVLAGISLILLIVLNIPMGRLINYILSGGLFIFGLKQLNDYYSLRNNKATKIITKDAINIGDNLYTKGDIDTIDFLVTSDDHGNSTGVLSIKTGGKNIPLVTILDEDYRFVKSDLNFLKELILDFMSIKQY